MRLIGKRSTTWVSLIAFVLTLIMPYIHITAKAAANAPVINITAPADGGKVYTNSVFLNYTLTDGVVTDIYRNGIATGLTSPGTIGGLTLGQNTLKVRAVNIYGVSEAEVKVYYDDEPQLTDLSPINGEVITATTGSFPIDGKCLNATSLTIKVNGTVVGPASQPPYGVGTIPTVNVPVGALVVGNNTITFEAANGTKNITRTIQITYTPNLPTVSNVTYIPTVFGSNVTISGSVSQNTTTLTLTNNGGAPINVPIAYNKTFSTWVTLTPGRNDMELVPNSDVTRKFTLMVYNEVKPQVTVTEPAEGAIVTTTTYEKYISTTNRTFTVKGRIDNATSAVIKFNNVDTAISNGDFNRSFTLLAGANEIKVLAKNAASSNVYARYIVYYNGLPDITVTNPADTSVQTRVYSSGYDISGKVANVTTNGLTIQRQGANQETVYFDSNGYFTKQVSLNPGVQTITLRATDGSTTTTKTFNIYFDDTPYITINAPAAGTTVTTNRVTVSGNVKNTDSNGLYINGEQINFSTWSGDFSREIVLSAGATNIEVKAKKGNRYTIKNIPIVYSGGPEVVISSHSDKANVYSNKITITGYLLGVLTQNTPYNQVDLKINNLTTTVDTNGRFSKEIALKTGTNTISANLKAGSFTSTKSIKLNYIDLAVEGAFYETTVTQNGGTVKAFENQVSLNIAKGVLPADSKLSFEILDPSDIDKDKDLVYVSQIVEIDGAKTNLVKPVTITMQYVAGMKETQAQKVALYYYDDGEWISIPSRVDTKKHTVTAQVDKLGRYAVMSYIKSFNDVIGHWAQGDIELLLAKGIASGKSSYMYYPDTYVTRAEFIKLLMEALGLPKYDAAYANFNDVDDDHWAYEYIQGAVRVGIVKGTSTYRFSPEKPITRAEAAAMISRAAGFKAMKKEEAKDLINKFKDKNYIGEWAETPIAEAMQAGILNGYTADTFRPNDNTTRAQAAKMIVRLMIQQKKL